MANNEFAFHFDGGQTEWADLRVVSFRLREAMSEPYEARIILHSRGEIEVDADSLVGALATLRVVTLSDPPIRVVHGLIAEAEEMGSSGEGLLYSVLLVPPHVRAAHRSRSRVFLEKTTKEIVETVLTGDPTVTFGDGDAALPLTLFESFVKPSSKVVWRVLDATRIEDKSTRSYCVQYQESDFAFVSRLLEEEGIAYHFEHTLGEVRLVLSDHDGGRAKLSPFDPVGPAIDGRHLDALRVGRRLRAGRVTLVDTNWRKPALDMRCAAKNDEGDLFVAAYPGGYPDQPAQGEPLARAMLERLQTEARFASARGTCRLLSAGSIFAMRHSTSRYGGEYLVVGAECRGQAIGEAGPLGEASSSKSFEMEVELVRRGVADTPVASNYRPARRTSKPRIIGSQTAIVSADPNNRDAEIHVGGPEGGEVGCVRLRFPWDTEVERHAREPTSTWVRVSQMFAGAGGGSVAHPRVGTEVIVEYLDGDPDRPLVVGRVYNGAQLPPAASRGAATVTTMKSLSSPGGKVFNELAFDDTAGHEKVNLTAGKDWSTEVGNNRVETVKNDSASTVKANRNEETTIDRKTHVGAKNEESVDGNEEITIGGRQTLTITSGQDMTVTADRNLTITGPHTVGVGPEAYTVHGAQSLTVTGAKSDSVGASFTQAVAAAMTTTAGSSFTVNTPVATINAPFTTVNAAIVAVNGAAEISLKTTVLEAVAAGAATLQGATIAVTASGEIVLSAGGSSLKISGAGIEMNGSAVKITGGSVDIAGGVVKVN